MSYHGSGPDLICFDLMQGNTLKKLRHPGIISVHKVEETKTSIVIETEPVVCSLADALRRDARSFDVRISFENE